MTAGFGLRRAGGGYTPDRPQISREDDAEVLSYGRRQGRDVDINLTRPPAIRAPISDLPTRPSPSWLPGPIPADDTSRQVHLSRGGGFGIRRDDGGAVPTIQTLGNQNPLQQQAYQHYAGMTEEQLQELALRTRGSPQGAIVQRVLQQKRMTPPAPPQQATDPAAGPPETYALGGMLEAKGGIRMPERGVSMGASPPSSGGLFHTAGPGRTDNIRINPKADSYILPADVVSGLGQGSTLSGAKLLDMQFKTGPYGAAISPTHVGHRMGPPHAPTGFSGHAAGGGTKTVPVEVAGGEYLLRPDQVQALGHSYCKPGSKTCSPEADISRGHDVLDALVLHIRKRTIKDLQGLKGPVKS